MTGRVLAWGPADLALQGHPVLHQAALRAGPGEFVALCGPNGAGKSTLLRALAGLVPGCRPDPTRIAWLPQGASCAWALTVEEVVALGRIPHRDRARAPVERALALAGLTDFRHRRIDRLSGGERRRVMLARALATAPQALLLDEPTADLDPAAAHALLALLARFAQEGGIVVAILHAVPLASLYATRLALLSAGRIVADGPPHAVLPHAPALFGLATLAELAGAARPEPSEPQA
jgi:iron complex transport system ATP-binding protein